MLIDEFYDLMGFEGFDEDGADTGIVVEFWIDFRLLGICFWREGFEAALGPERRG